MVDIVIHTLYGSKLYKATYDSAATD